MLLVSHARLAPLVFVLLPACASQPPARPTEAKAKGDTALIPLSYQVSRAGTEGQPHVVLEGRLDADPRRVFEVTQHAAKTAEKEELLVRAHPRDDGSVDVEVRYKEVTSDGAHFDWGPIVHVRRGGEAVADIRGTDGTHMVKFAIP